MSHSIKVTDEVLELIHKYQFPRESLSQTIQRAFNAMEIIDEARKSFREHPHFPGGVKQEVG